jgi:hypothetical protein
MPWFKVDDGFTSSRKVISIPRQHRMVAIGAWTMAGNFAAKELTDGHVPQYYLDEIGATDDIVNLLINADLWLKHEDGIQFKNWCDYQPSATSYRDRQDAMKAKRSQDGKIAAAKRWQKESNGLPNGSPIGSAMGSDAPEPEPEPEPFTSNEVKIYDDFDSEFDKFWSAYPRKENKQSARRAMKSALKKTPFYEILAGANRYRLDPNRDPAFTKHAATWLNNECWNDDPLPARGSVNVKQQQQAVAAERFLANFEQPKEITSEPDWA